MCSTVFEAFGTARTVTAPVQHAESESVDSLRIGAIRDSRLVVCCWVVCLSVLLALNQRISAVCGRGGLAPRD